MTKKRNIIKFAIVLPILFIGILIASNLLSLKANSLSSIANENYYNYNYNLNITDSSYFLSVENNIDDELIDNLVETGSYVNQQNLYIYINNIRYDTLTLVADLDGLGGLECFLFSSTTNERMPLYSYYVGIGEDYRYNGIIQLYKNNSYVIQLSEPLNLILNFQNKVAGFYTFNQNYYGLDISLNDSNYYYTNFSLKGSWTYQNDTGAFIESIDLNIESPYSLSINTKTYGGALAGVSIFENFDDMEQYRYLYLSPQYIDSILYDWLKLNGTFDFVLPLENYNVSFFDVVNAYMNIPVQIMSSFWSVSVFNTGYTILTIFATILAIALAIKVGKMFI